MDVRYLALVLVTSLCLGSATAGPPANRHCGEDQRARYSARALRRLRTELQLRLLEERRRRIQLAYQILARHGNPAELLHLPDDAAIFAQGAVDARMKHLPMQDATTCW